MERPAKVETATAICVYSYEATEQDQLSLEEGELIQVLQKSDSWWFGQKVKGKQCGWFPAEYVKLSGRNVGAIASRFAFTQIEPTNRVVNSNASFSHAIRPKAYFGYERNNNFSQSFHHEKPPQVVQNQTNRTVDSRLLFKGRLPYDQAEPNYYSPSPRIKPNYPTKEAIPFDYRLSSNEIDITNQYEQTQQELIYEEISEYQTNDIIQPNSPTPAQFQNFETKPSVQTELDKVIAICTHVSERPDEMDIEVNDIIFVLERKFPKWWYGHNQRTGATGLFKSEIVRPFDNKTYQSNDEIYQINNRNNFASKQQLQHSSTFKLKQEGSFGNRNLAYLNTTNNYYNDNLQYKNSNYPPQQQEMGPIWNRSEDQKMLSIQSAMRGVERLSIFTPSISNVSSRDNPFMSTRQYSTQSEASVDSFDSDTNNSTQDNYDNYDNESHASSSKSSQLYSYRLMNANNGQLEDQKSRDSQQRFYIIDELLNTEHQYISQLYFTLQNFQEAIQKSNLMPEHDVNAIFAHLQAIYDVNYGLYNNLIQRTRNEEGGSTDDRISEVFIDHFQLMLPVYQNYCSSKMAELLIKIDVNEQVGAELVRISVQKKSYQTFRSGLIRPMQRITRYRPLIEKLLKFTPPGHPDHEECKMASNFARQFCEDINKIYDKACEKWEPFKKLLWIQKHVVIPNKQLDQSLDFNSETRFLGPRTLLHWGVLFNNNKMLLGFLFSDFILLTTPDKRLRKSPKGVCFEIDIFESRETRDHKYILFEKPFLLNELQLAKKNDYKATQNSPLFQIELISQKKYISMRVNSLDEWACWWEAIDKAKRNYCKMEHLFRDIDTVSVFTPRETPIAVFTLVSVEAFQLYSRNYALNAYFKVVLGKSWLEGHSTITSNPVRRVMDFSTPIQPEANKSFLTNLKERTRKSLAFASEEPLEDPHRIVWEKNTEFNVFNSDDTLFIQCFDANPYAPHQLLGTAKITIKEMLQLNQYFKVTSSRELICQKIPLEIPNEQLSKNFSHKLNIEPYLLIKFDLAIHTDVHSIMRLYDNQLASDF